MGLRRIVRPRSGSAGRESSIENRDETGATLIRQEAWRIRSFIMRKNIDMQGVVSTLWCLAKSIRGWLCHCWDSIIYVYDYDYAKPVARLAATPWINRMGAVIKQLARIDAWT